MVVVVAAAVVVVVVVVVQFRSLFTWWLNNVVANYRESESNGVTLEVTVSRNISITKTPWP